MQMAGPGSSLLDLGCGKANPLLKRGEVSELHGIDIDSDAVRVNKSITSGETADLQSRALDRRGFDGLVSYDVLEHVERPDALIRNAVVSLKPGGFLFLVTPNCASIFGLVSRVIPLGFRHWLLRFGGDLTMNHVHYYRANTVRDLTHIIRKAGCEVVEMHVVNRLPSSRLLRALFLPGYLLCRLPGLARMGSGLFCIARKAAAGGGDVS